MMVRDTAAARTDGVWKIFQQEAEAVQAVCDVSLTVERGEFTALAGPSGSGKTTLLNLIGGLTRPTRGRVWVAGREVSRMPSRQVARLRLEEVGFVFQAYNLLPVLTAARECGIPDAPPGRGRQGASRACPRALCADGDRGTRRPASGQAVGRPAATGGGGSRGG